MKITITFGFEGVTKIVDWLNPIDQFPKHLRHNGKKWEWIAYDKDFTGKSDYAIFFGELPTYDPNFYIDMEDFETKFYGFSLEGCTCGAEHTSFPFDHMRYCKKYTKW